MISEPSQPLWWKNQPSIEQMQRKPMIYLKLMIMRLKKKTINVKLFVPQPSVTGK